MADPFTLAIDLDYSSGPTPSSATDLEGWARELDEIDRKHREQCARLVVVCRSIEHSRRGVVELDCMTYSSRKIEMAELQASISRLETDLYFNHYESEQWPAGLTSPIKVTLKQLWALWRNVEAARQAEAALPDKPVCDKPVTDLGFADYCARCLADIPARQRIDAKLTRERAEWIYDCALRVFEGRKRWDWNEHCRDGSRMRKPKRPLRTGNKRSAFTRSSFVGA